MPWNSHQIAWLCFLYFFRVVLFSLNFRHKEAGSLWVGLGMAWHFEYQHPWFGLSEKLLNRFAVLEVDFATCWAGCNDSSACFGCSWCYSQCVLVRTEICHKIMFCKSRIHFLVFCLKILHLQASPSASQPLHVGSMECVLSDTECAQQRTSKGYVVIMSNGSVYSECCRSRA